MSLSPKPLLLLPLALGALALAACGDEGDGGGDASAAPAAAISVADIDDTSVLADADGRTLYTSDAEASGKVRCTGECTSIWDPALGSAADAQAAADDTGADIGAVKRPDGGTQLTLDGVPLYAFTQEGAGELTGDGVSDEFSGTAFTWSAATTGGAPAPPDDSGGTGGGYGSY